jgi:hypothetical protein
VVQREAKIRGRFPCKLSSLSNPPNNLEVFQVALDTHENLLHAETQAIAAKHLDTIEEILSKKDASLEILLDSKSKVIADIIEKDPISLQIERILELQQRNSDSFKKFFDERSRKERGLNEKLSMSDQRLRSTYFKSGS